jgi:hypothetical protein
VYVDSNNTLHSWVRALAGSFTEFNVPGAGIGAGQGTVPQGLNAEGAITGSYIDSNGVGHGFVRSPVGAITTFDAPGAGTGAGQGTFPLLNNIEGAINSGAVYHGFLQSKKPLATIFWCEPLLGRRVCASWRSIARLWFGVSRASSR